MFLVFTTFIEECKWILKPKKLENLCSWDLIWVGHCWGRGQRWFMSPLNSCILVKSRSVVISMSPKPMLLCMELVCCLKQILFSRSAVDGYSFLDLWFVWSLYWKYHVISDYSGNRFEFRSLLVWIWANYLALLNLNIILLCCNELKKGANVYNRICLCLTQWHLTKWQLFSFYKHSTYYWA